MLTHSPSWYLFGRPARLFATAALLLAAAAAQTPVPPERKVDPSFLRRKIAAVAAKPADVTTATCGYKPLFGAGDSEASIVRGVARFGEITVAPRGACQPINPQAEEQAYVIMEGTGVLEYAGKPAPLRRHDFLYLPAGVERRLSNPADAPLRLFVMGFKLADKPAPPPELMIANYDDVSKQTVGSHPDSVVYQLMMGDVSSKRDRLAAAHVLTSLYVMEFAPGGTNFPTITTPRRKSTSCSTVRARW